MRYIERSFTLPTNTKEMTDVMWLYRTGQITAEEYEQKTGHKPDKED